MHTFGEKMSNTKIKELTQEKTKEIVDAINQIENKEIMVNVSRAKIKPDAEFVFLFIENVYSVQTYKANVSNSVKKLTQRGIFYKEGRSLYMNWKYLAKGNLTDFIKAEREKERALRKVSGFTS